MIANLAIAGWISQTQVKDTKKGMMTTCIHIAIVNCIGVLLFFSKYCSRGITPYYVSWINQLEVWYFTTRFELNRALCKVINNFSNKQF